MLAQKLDASLILVVAPVIKAKYPKQAIAMYEHLVQTNIDHKKRWSYKEAATYAGEIKLIYEIILKDPITWQKYVTGIRQTHPNYPALLGEFRVLG